MQFEADLKKWTVKFDGGKSVIEQEYNRSLDAWIRKVKDNNTGSYAYNVICSAKLFWHNSIGSRIL